MDPLTPISAHSRELPLRPLSQALMIASFLISLMAPPFALRLLADDQKPPPSNEQTDKSAQAAQREPKASATPRPKPGPAPGQGAASAGAPTGPAPAAAKAAQPLAVPKPALRFDDFDLEKYHKPVPKEADEEDEAVEEPAAEPAAPGLSPVAPATPRPRPKVRPRPTPVEPAADPLKSFRDREAMDKFRQSQIESGRLRIAKLQDRLNYLNAKKDALNNPAPMLVGQTQVQNPPKPGEAPAPPTPIQGPGRGITAKPGTGTVPVMGLFPPIPPPQTDEDRENDKKLKVKDLLLQVEEEIKSVQEDLETAKDELAAVETRFAGSPSR